MGKLSKEVGTTFEKLFEVHCRQRQMAFIKIPDGCRRVSLGGLGVKLIPVKTPFDFFICKNGKSATVDCKTIDAALFKYSLCDQDQVNALTVTGEHIPSGYIIWFRETNRVVFFSVVLLRMLQQRTSLRDTDGLLLGDIDRFNPELILNLTVKPNTQGTLI
ncbi:unnamed protein product [Sphagnum jensenii]|uniref:Holliday junction resolvase n=1 Tax=Sphagnum jensenii TaxID=128206 RepID=A0ABP0V8D0_9BRYO